MKKVYVAGKLNDMAIDYVHNMHRMVKLAIEARNAGFSVFVPCLDIWMGLMAGNWDYDDYFQNSQPWLEASDAVLVVKEHYQDSEGTLKEIAAAQENNIPVFFSVSQMIAHYHEQSI